MFPVCYVRFELDKSDLLFYCVLTYLRVCSDLVLNALHKSKIIPNVYIFSSTDSRILVILSKVVSVERFFFSEFLVGNYTQIAKKVDRMLIS